MNRPFTYAPPDGDLDILHLDDDLLLVNKPSGLLSVPGKALENRDCLETRIRDAYPEILLIHRLDLDTSGVMIFARTKQAQRHINLQFQQRQTEKTYIARVWGQVTPESGTVDLPLIVDWPNRPIQMVDHVNGKSAITNWNVLEHEANATRMELRPITGRSHQLRVHMLAIGHPILGDRFYGTEEVTAAADRMQLHALTLRLRHPAHETWLDFSAACPF